ncbi:YoaK family protein [Mucilaginibacter sp.]|uniref:YoaK family protein n=1 Tax=Mucilaginibacter sp. TaxID=1882438 RepID=UPI003D0A23CB
MLRESKGNRSLKENLMLASSTAFVSGMINVAGMIAFFAFTSNITGHVANLARHIVDQNFREIIVFAIWLLLFFAGAFLSSFIVRSLSHTSYYRAHAVPVVIEIIILLFVAVYGQSFYNETKLEREVVIGGIIFSMGLQNSLVSTISGGLIKSSHLTGLFTDLGGDVAEWLHPREEKTNAVRNRIYIRLTILCFYLIGAVIGGYLFNMFDLAIFYFIPFILLTILYYDLSPLALHKLTRLFSPTVKNN